MNSDQLALARRLVAHPRWANTYPPNYPPPPAIVFDTVRQVMDPLSIPPPGVGGTMAWVPRMLPDLTDYATAAILLRMAVEAIGSIEGGIDHLSHYAHGDLHAELGYRFSHKAGSHRWGLGMAESGAGTFGDVRGEDLGTVAAQALLAAWGEP